MKKLKALMIKCARLDALKVNRKEAQQHRDEANRKCKAAEKKDIKKWMHNDMEDLADTLAMDVRKEEQIVTKVGPK